jgi:Kdo2-lipid IVA lauroyltransferase/acyltransferase
MMTRLGVFLLWLIHFLPFKIQGLLGDSLGALLYLFAHRRRRIATINLRLCFPQMTDSARARMVRQNFQFFSRSVIERGILWWSNRARLQKLIRVEGREHFDNALGQPLILLTAHFVGLDVGGSWIIQNANGVSVYARQKNKFIGQLLLEKRGRFGKQLLYARQDGLRPVIKALRAGRPFYYFTDQDFSTKDSVFVSFFGIPTATLATLPRLVEMAGAKVVPCMTRVLPHYQGYEVRFYPAWENYPTDDAVADTRRMNEFIEQRVLEMPEQYFWLHRRFKTRPPNPENMNAEENFYP